MKCTANRGRCPHPQGRVQHNTTPEYVGFCGGHRRWALSLESRADRTPPVVAAMLRDGTGYALDGRRQPIVSVGELRGDELARRALAVVEALGGIERAERLAVVLKAGAAA